MKDVSDRVKLAQEDRSEPDKSVLDCGFPDMHCPKISKDDEDQFNFWSVRCMARQFKLEEKDLAELQWSSHDRCLNCETGREQFKKHGVEPPPVYEQEKEKK